MTLPTLLTDVTLTGVVSGATTVAQLSPKPYDREIRRAAIIGPIGSSFDVYLGMISSVCRAATTRVGQQNEANFSQTIRIPAGYVTYFVWSAYGAASASTVTLSMNRA